VKSIWIKLELNMHFLTRRLALLFKFGGIYQLVLKNLSDTTSRMD